MLPEFNSEGLLPAGDYPLTLGQLKNSLLVNGPIQGYPDWDREWRSTLVNNLEVMVKELWGVGIGEIFIDGSFVTDVDHPNDIDGYFCCDPRNLRSLSLID